MSKKKLTNQDKYNILNLVGQNKSLDEIIDNTGFTEDVIITYLEENVKLSEKSKINKDKDKTRFQRIHEKDGFSKRGATVMTGPKAMILDEAKKQAHSNQDHPGIFRPFNRHGKTANK